MGKTRVLACTCKSEYQDKRYGKGQRVMNPLTDKKYPNTHRCTVCSKVRAE